MKRLREKLRSQRGASILLALLMLLVCMMVGSSVLAAAASNAGKIQSNRVEQQKYLTLSSAIQLIAEELAQARYTGRYQLWEWEVTTTVTDKSDPSHPVATVASESFFYCKQLGWETSPAAYSCGDLTDQLPLGKELDEIFSQQFRAKGDKAAGYEALEGTDVEPSIVRTLTVTLPDNLAGYPDSGLEPYQAPKTVTVQVKLDHSTKHILLTAWLGNEPTAPAGGKDTMIAELVAKQGTLPVLGYTPGGRKKGDLPIPSSSSSVSGSLETTITVNTTADGQIFPKAGEPAVPMQWELNWIKKGAA